MNYIFETLKRGDNKMKNSTIKMSKVVLNLKSCRAIGLIILCMLISTQAHSGARVNKKKSFVETFAVVRNYGKDKSSEWKSSMFLPLGTEITSHAYWWNGNKKWGEAYAKGSWNGGKSWSTSTSKANKGLGVTCGGNYFAPLPTYSADSLGLSQTEFSNNITLDSINHKIVLSNIEGFLSSSSSNYTSVIYIILSYGSFHGNDSTFYASNIIDKVSIKMENSEITTSGFFSPNDFSISYVVFIDTIAGDTLQLKKATLISGLTKQFSIPASIPLDSIQVTVLTEGGYGNFIESLLILESPPTNHITSISISGTINGLPCTMIGTTGYSNLCFPGSTTNIWTYSSLPSTFPAMAAPCIDWGGCAEHQPYGNALNLMQVSGGNLHIQRDATYYNSSGIVIGQLTILGNLIKTSDTTSSLIATRSGTYTGPIDIVSVSGFTHSLHQQCAGLIIGSYNTLFITSTGEVLTRNVIAEYTYSGLCMLPGDEEAVVTLDSIIWDSTTQTLTQAGTGFVQLVGTIPTLPILITATPTHAICFGAYDGAIAVTIEGGTGPYVATLKDLLPNCCDGFDCGNPLDCGSDCHCSTSVTLFEGVLREVQGLPASEYSIEVYDANGCFASDTIIITEPSELQVFAGIDATINEGDSYYISDASLFNYGALQWETSGDGFFDDATLLSSTYTPGLADISAVTVVLCLTAYPIEPCTVSVTDCMTLIIIPEGSQLQITDVPENWSLISSYLAPFNPSMAYLFAEMVNQNKFEVMLGNGIYWPSGSINTIGNWDVYQAYKIKMNAPGWIELIGEIPEDKTITLNAGANYIPVLSMEYYPAEDIFEQLGDDLIFAYDLYAQLLHWPQGGIYSLEVFEPGKGYLVGMSQPGQATYNPPTKSISQNYVPAKPKVYENAPWSITKSGSTHLISINRSALEELEFGDYIGVFNNEGVCAGFTQYDDETGNLLLVAYGNDFTAKANNGFAEGEFMAVRIFNTSTMTEKQVSVVYDASMPNTGTFADNGLAMIVRFKTGAASVDEPGLDGITIYPNPSKGIFNIAGYAGTAEIAVYNAFGIEAFRKSLKLPSSLDLSGQPNGIYLITIKTDKHIFFEKLVVN